MFLFDCFDERLKLISISNCFDLLLNLLLSCQETRSVVSVFVNFGFILITRLRN